jgi:hypothetical protein
MAILMIMIMSAIIPGNIDSLLINAGIINDTGCAEVNDINQYFFANHEFYQLDTGCVIVVITPADKSGKPLRIAIDYEFNLYKLFGFKDNDFNLMVADNNITVSTGIAYNYGMMYLDITRFYDPYGIYFISDVDDFINYNRKLMLDSLYHFSEEEKNWESELRNIKEFCRDKDFKNIIYDTDTEVYTLDYYVWQLYDGNIINITLNINANGSCFILHDSTVAKNVGYWYYFMY